VRRRSQLYLLTALAKKTRMAQQTLFDRIGTSHSRREAADEPAVL